MLKKLIRRMGKRAVAVLAAAVLLYGLAGCGKKEAGSSAPDSVSSVPQSVPNAETSISQSSVVSTDSTGLSETQSASTGIKTDFDFDEAVKNIDLFGHKISLPCYWSDFSEDFSLGDIRIPSDNDLMCQLLYKGDKIGNIFFTDCENEDEIESCLIKGVTIGFSLYGYPYDPDYNMEFLETAGYYTGLLELYMGNISMSYSESDIIAELGEPTVSGDDTTHYLNYYYDNGHLNFYIDREKLTEWWIFLE